MNLPFPIELNCVNNVCKIGSIGGKVHKVGGKMGSVSD